VTGCRGARCGDLGIGVISDAVDAFQKRHQELALVCDDENSIVGLITATDAFEAVLGELEDPLDLELQQ